MRSDKLQESLMNILNEKQGSLRETKKTLDDLYSNEELENIWNEKFDELVPKEGKASTTLGEIMRNFSSLSYALFQNGDIMSKLNYQPGYYKNAEDLDDAVNKLGDNQLKQLINKMWNTRSESAYDHYMAEFYEYFIDNYLKEKVEEATNLQDMRNSYIDSYKRRGYEDYKSGDNFVCLIDKQNEEPVAVMFYGRAGKPTWHYRFRNIDELDKYVDKFLQSKEEIEQRKADRRAQRKITKDHDIKVGDIFYTYWGYDQTNSEFYEVVKVSGSRLYLKELAYETDYSDSSWGQDKIKPVPGKYVSNEIHTASARADGTVTNLDGESFLSLSKYEGGYINVTSSGWGH